MRVSVHILNTEDTEDYQLENVTKTWVANGLYYVEYNGKVRAFPYRQHRELRRI